MDTASKTWKERMQAALEHPRSSELQSVAEACSLIADKALIADAPRRKAAAALRGMVDYTPLWSEMIDGLVRFVRQRKIDTYSKGARLELVRCAEVADAVESGEVAGA